MIEDAQNFEISRSNVIMDILLEREIAFARWGDQDSRPNNLWLDIIEARTTLINNSLDNSENLYKEVIQAATILVAWAEKLRHQDLKVNSG